MGRGGMTALLCGRAACERLAFLRQGDTDFDRVPPAVSIAALCLMLLALAMPGTAALPARFRLPALHQTAQLMESNGMKESMATKHVWECTSQTAAVTVIKEQMGVKHYRLNQ